MFKGDCTGTNALSIIILWPGLIYEFYKKVLYMCTQ